MLSNTGHIMTLANSIIGVGILAMPFCFQKCGIILSIVLLIMSNFVTRICCHYLIKISLLTRRKSFEFLGFHAFGSSGKLLVELCIIGYLLGTCITYFVVVGDLGPQIVKEMFGLDSNHRHLRTILMIAVTVVCIIPLGMLKNVDSLSMVFTASIGFYVCLVLKIILESEEHILANDWQSKVIYWRPAGILQCLPIFSMALSCQMQLFEVFNSVNNQSLEKLNNIVKNSLRICTCVYISVGFFGYVAFCMQEFSGNILLNFSNSFSSDIIKIGFILSVAFSFPLVIFPCRASIYSLLYRKGQTDMMGYIPETRFKVITIGIVVFSLCIALIIPSVELIIGLVGSTIGVAICIMFPAACFRKIVRKNSTERVLGQMMIAGGFCLMILGTFANLNAIDEKRSGTHLELPEQIAIVNLPVDLTAHIIATKSPIENIEHVLKNEQLNKDTYVNEKKLEQIITPTLPPAAAPPPPPEQPLPPLPVDEVHVAESKLPPPTMAPAIEDDSKLLKAKENEKNENEKKVEMETKVLSSVAAGAILVKPKTNEIESHNESQQTIAKEAIKKEEEEIVAEEQKTKDVKENVQVKELKETQKELLKTKELLEKTVDELKQELAKQNQETQNLVAEKLEEVVEKVEQIERKVQQKNEAQIVDIVKPKLPIAADVVNKLNEQRPNVLAAEGVKSQENASNVGQPKNSSLLRILSENKSVNIYEPLSYKTGELIESARNKSGLEHRLPLPLALLINSPQAKMNMSTELIKKNADNDHNEVEQNALKAKPIDDNKKEQSKLPTINVENKLKKADENVHVPVPVAVSDDDKKEKENVEAIRREILQFSLDSNTQNAREKRSIQRQGEECEEVEAKADNKAMNVDNKKIEQVNDSLMKCNDKPNLDKVLLSDHGLLENALDLKMHGIIGRELLAVNDEHNTTRESL